MHNIYVHSRRGSRNRYQESLFLYFCYIIAMLSYVKAPSNRRIVRPPMFHIVCSHRIRCPMYIFIMSNRSIRLLYSCLVNDWNFDSQIWIKFALKNEHIKYLFFNISFIAGWKTQSGISSLNYERLSTNIKWKLNIDVFRLFEGSIKHDKLHSPDQLHLWEKEIKCLAERLVCNIKSHGVYQSR